MPHILDLCHCSSPNYTHHVIEKPLRGSHKVSYRAHDEWDFEAGTDAAAVDIDLVMPPHRPKNQPEHHRTNMFISSETGPMRVKVCRHCLNRSFNLEVVGGTSDITIWVPSNFHGFITYTSCHKPIFSAGFANHILANAVINRPVPKDWHGDELTVSTAGTITFRMWDVFAKSPEVPAKELWRKVFKGAERRTDAPNYNWDFLLEDDD